MRRFLFLTVLAVVTASLFGILASGGRQSAADTGDNLASFDATVTAGIPLCQGTKTGIAFDGLRLYLSCGGSNVLERVIASGAHGSAGPITITGMTSIDALAYDASAGGGKIWACQQFFDVYLIILAPLPPALPTTATATYQFTSSGCRDGLAYDGVDDTIWSSGDGSDSIQHYTTNGVLIDSFSSLVGKLGGFGNSGIAVGGSTLYLANNGGSQIYQCDKGLVVCSLMSTFVERLEDLECDDVTFPGKNAIWSQDAFDRILNAWEIPAGTCGLGGLPANSSITICKEAVPGNTGQQFTFSLSSDVALFVVTPLLDNECYTTPAPPGDYFVEELVGLLPPRWILENIECFSSGFPTGIAFHLGFTGTPFQLLPEANVTCTFTNRLTAVGGVAGLLEADDHATVSESHRDTVGYIIVLAGVVGATLIAGGWYARRRSLR